MVDKHSRDRKRTPDGDRFAAEYEDKEFLTAVREHQPRATTKKIREHVGCDHTTAFRRLVALSDAGKLHREKIGSSYLWNTTDQ